MFAVVVCFAAPCFELDGDCAVLPEEVREVAADDNLVDALGSDGAEDVEDARRMCSDFYRRRV